MYYKSNELKSITKTTEFHFVEQPTTAKLDELGFRYYRQMSDDEDHVYVYSFPVHRYYAYTTLEGRILVHLEENLVTIDVFDAGTRGIYGPWYYDLGGSHKDLIAEINANIRKELTRLKIVER